MKIATWNIDRSHIRQRWRMPEQQRLLESHDADLYLLTEVSDRIWLHGKPAVHFSDPGEPPYLSWEHASGIWTSWPVLQTLKCRDSRHAACAVLDSPIGQLVAYATIIPFHGARHTPGDRNWTAHRRSLSVQLDDWRDLRNAYPTHHMVIAGDFNMSMGNSDSYVDPKSRAQMRNACEDLGLKCLTDLDLPSVRKEGKPNIDHVIASKTLAQSWDVSLWMGTAMRDGVDRDLSDHNGVTVKFAPADFKGGNTT